VQQIQALLSYMFSSQKYSHFAIVIHSKYHKNLLEECLLTHKAFQKTECSHLRAFHFLKYPESFFLVIPSKYLPDTCQVSHRKNNLICSFLHCEMPLTADIRRIEPFLAPPCMGPYSGTAPTASAVTLHKTCKKTA
jgi:hypothetical protein